MRKTFLWICSILLVAPAIAAANQKITDAQTFHQLVQSHHLKRAFITLEVDANGSITGTAFGRPVRGDWSWQEGYFCRTLFWGTRDLGYNCQEVRHSGDRLIFQSDRGTGDSADFKRIPKGN